MNSEKVIAFRKAILKELARIAVERGCGRLEWWCLDWNRLLHHWRDAEEVGWRSLIR